MTALITNENAHEFRAIAAQAAIDVQNNTGARQFDLVDDQASYALVRIIEKFDRIGDDQVSNPIGLAYSVAYRAVYDEIKMRTRWGKTRQHRKEHQSLDSDDGNESALWRRVSRAYFYDFSPYDEIDARVSIPRLMELLSPTEQYVVTRFFMDRDKQEDIADALGYDQGAVSNIKKRALAKMRRAFERDGTL